MTATRTSTSASTGVTPRAVLQGVVEQATKAPSIHNTQPWRFGVRGDVVEVWTDPSRGLRVLDPTGRARHLSCGAALLHARVAAAAAGYATEVTAAPDDEHPDHLADLRLDASRPAAETDQKLGLAIPRRRTSRSPFTAEPLPADVVSALRRAAEEEGCWLRVVDDADDAAAVAVLFARADELERADPAYVDELRDWTRRDEGSGDGVPASAVPEADPAGRGSNVRLRDFVADRDDTAGADVSSEPPPAERPVVVVLGTRGDDVAAWLAAGQGMARLLLTATSLGVSASPMTQPLEIAGLRALLAAELGVVGHPQMVLRLGYSGQGDDSLATPRRPVADVLTVTDG